MARWTIQIDAANGSPKRKVVARYGARQIHCDSFDPDEAWRREAFGKAVVARWPMEAYFPGFDGEREAVQIADQIVAEAARKESDNGATQFRRITSAELAQAARTPPNWLVQGIIVAGEPMLVTGAEKCLKTTITAELAISLATTTPFLGEFPIPRAVNVGFMSGESGDVTLGETGLRIANAKGIDFERDCPNLVWSDELPSLDNPADLDGIAEFVKGDALEVLIIDPMYLCMDLEGRESSMFAVGRLMRRIATLCKSMGVTPIILHHTKGTDEGREFRPPRLQDIAWAGFKQFARQWIMLSRREPYEVPGQHALWMVAGGSRGHGGTYGLDIQEGRYPARTWELSLLTHDDAMQSVEAAKAKGKSRKQGREKDAEIDGDAKAIMQIVVELKSPKVKNDYKSRVKFSGERFGRAWARLLDEGHLHEWPAQKSGNHRSFPAFWIEPPPPPSAPETPKNEEQQDNGITTGQERDYPVPKDNRTTGQIP